jgi:hypothetical protein
MTTSTFLSLLYVPVAYTYFDSFGTLLGRLFHWCPRVPFRRRPRGAAVPAPTPARRAAAPVRGAAPPLPAVGGVGSRGGLIAVTRRPPDWRAPRWQPRSIRQNPADGHAEPAAPSGEPAVLRRAG